MNTQTHAAHIRSDAERFAAIVERGPVDAPVAACPGWDVAQLARHLGSVHRWARHAVLHARQPDNDPDVPGDDATSAELAAWLRAGAAALTDALISVDPAAPTWHPFPVARVAGVWPRRQAIETALHRWDAEDAVGEPTPIDPELASDGIDEYFELGLPRLMVREDTALPAGSLHLHCTDVAGEWLVENRDGVLEVRREHAKGDAAIRGPAEPMLLRLWNRAGNRAAELEIVGDAAVAEAWTVLPGM